MDFLNDAKSVQVKGVEELIDFSTYDNTDPREWDRFMSDLDELFSIKDDEKKEQIRKAGNFASIMDYADLYFDQNGSTVKKVTELFHKLMKLKEVRGDSSGYRWKIADRFDEDRNSFRYPRDFTIAYNLILRNRKELLA